MHYVFGRGYAEYSQDASKQKIFRRASVIQGMRAARTLKRTWDEGAISQCAKRSIPTARACGVGKASALLR